SKSYVMIQQNSVEHRRTVKQASFAQVVQRTAYGLSGTATQLTLKDPWRKDSPKTESLPSTGAGGGVSVVGGGPAGSTGGGASGSTQDGVPEGPGGGSLADTKSDISTTLRGILVFSQSEELQLIEEPLTENVQGQEIPLDTLYHDLSSGRWVIFSGE